MTISLDGGLKDVEESLRAAANCYGPDADTLFQVIKPVLKASPEAKGGFAIKRYGEASDPEAREVKVKL